MQVGGEWNVADNDERRGIGIYAGGVGCVCRIGGASERGSS